MCSHANIFKVGVHRDDGYLNDHRLLPLELRYVRTYQETKKPRRGAGNTLLPSLGHSRSHVSTPALCHRCLLHVACFQPPCPTSGVEGTMLVNLTVHRFVSSSFRLDSLGIFHLDMSRFPQRLCSTQAYRTPATTSYKAFAQTSADAASIGTRGDAFPCPPHQLPKGGSQVKAFPLWSRREPTFPRLVVPLRRAPRPDFSFSARPRMYPRKLV
ncbi:hypothetical protein LXA43DRAFT_544226 [Ganoderma leucocontextum]|nr:hypothetical protein LXA43DRAFT_544226 [Ganoderma leucocontextum]